MPAKLLKHHDPMTMPSAQSAVPLLNPAAEAANAVTHGSGLVLSLGGAGMLLRASWNDSSGWCLTGCLIYSATVVGVYAVSTLSHAVQHPQWRSFYRRWDQGLIYLMIAGTYTPIGLVFLRTGPGWLLTAAMWGIAIAGFLSKVIWHHRVASTAVWTYLALGWFPLLAWPQVQLVFPWPGLQWMVAGGLAYTLGTAFLVADRYALYFHALWHVWVIIGSACHFLAIYCYVVPFAM